MTRRRFRRSLIVLVAVALAFVVAGVAVGVDRGSRPRPAPRRHDAHAGDGTEPAERRAARALVQLGARRDSTPNVPSLHDNVTALAQMFIDEGRIEGVRGDIAFVQSILETGWFSFVGLADPARREQLRRASTRSTAGPASRTASTATPRRAAASRPPQLGVLAQIQLLRSYADADREAPRRTG